MVKNIQPSTDRIRRNLVDLTCRFAEGVDVPSPASEFIAPSMLELSSMEAMRRIGNLICERAEAKLQSADVRFPIDVPVPPCDEFDCIDEHQSEYSTLQQPIERAVSTQLRKLDATPDHCIIEWLSQNQACWMQDLAFRQARMATWLETNRNELNDHERIMRETRSKYPLAMNTSITDQNRLACDYFQEILQKKFYANGFVPELIVHHDFDDSLTVDYEEYSDEIPCRNLMTLSRACLDAAELPRARVRAALLASLMSLPGFERVLKEQLQRAVAATRIFPAALRLLRSSSPGVRHRILSANFGCHVRANLIARLSQNLKVTALEGNSYRGPEKFLHVMESVIAFPDALHLAVDDGDNRLINAINQRTSHENSDDGVRLEDLAILCCRTRSQGLNYPLNETLKPRGIIHGANENDYDSTSSFVHAYSQKVKRLSANEAFIASDV